MESKKGHSGGKRHLLQSGGGLGILRGARPRRRPALSPARIIPGVAIEGCTLSLEAVKGLVEGKKASGYPNKDVRMAQNYLAAMEKA